MSFVKVRCPHCDAESNIDAVTCTKCGKGLRAAAASEQGRESSAHRKGAGMTVVLLLVGSTFAALFGLLLLSQATMGAGVILFACWLAILARIAQAGDHYFGR